MIINTKNFSKFLAILGLVAPLSPALADQPAAIAPNKAATQAVAAKVATDLAPEFVAAIYNGREIKVAELDSEIKRKPAFSMWQNMGSDDPEMKNRVRLAALNGIINRDLLLNSAKSSGVIVEAEVQKSVDGLVAGYGGKDKLTPLVQAIGTTYEQFTAEVADDFRITSYIDKSLAKDIKISEADAKKQFDAEPNKYVEGERIKVSHILIKADPNATAEQDQAAKAKIDALYLKASAKGADFAAIAKESSQCPSAPGGGDLGVIGKGKTVPAFEQAAFALKAGEISKPVRSQFGYHIIKVAEHLNAEKPDFAKARTQIEKELMSQRKGQLIEAKVNDLRSKAQIKINLAS